MRLPHKWTIVLVWLVVAVKGAAQGTSSELFAQAAALAKQGDFEASIAKLEAAKALSPSDYKVNLLLGTDLLRIGKPEAALPSLRIAAEAASDNGSAAAYLGSASFAVGSFGSAADSFQRAVSRAPQSEEFLAKWGDFSLERFRTLQTELQASQSGMAALLRFQAERTANSMRLELLERSALADSQQPGIWGELGVASLQSGNGGKAEETLRVAQKQQAESLWTLQLQAMLASQQGDWREAETRLVQIAERSPAVFLRVAREWPARLRPPRNASGVAWNCVRLPTSACAMNVAVRQTSADDNPAALFAKERWEELAAASPQDNDILAKYWRGTALAELHDYPRAIPVLEDGLDAGQEHAAFLLLICYAAAAKDVTERLAAAHFGSSSHRLRGDFLVRVGDDAKSAIAEYQQAIQLQPRDPLLQERLAQAYWSERRVAEAQRTGEAALALQPNRPVTLRLLVSIAMEERDYAAAERALDKLLALTPGDSWAKVQLGIAAAQTGQFERAVTLLQQEVAHGYPDDHGAIHAILARSLRKLGRNTEAAEAEADSTRLADRFQQGALKVPDEVQ